MADMGRHILGGRLFRKYAALIAIAFAILLAVTSAIDIWWSYREQEALLIRVQRTQADAAAARIADFVRGIEAQMRWSTHLAWDERNREQRKLEALRLLRQVPAITEIALIDMNGQEQVKVSRLAKDEVGSGIDRSQDIGFVAAMARKVHYGRVHFRHGSEPHMSIALAGERRAAGVSIAEINLKSIWDVVNEIRIGSQGIAFVIDAEGRLIAHPDISLVLRSPDLSHLPHVEAARHSERTTQPPAGAVASIAGKFVLSARAGVAPLGWHVFVELPVAEAYTPIYVSLGRSLASLAIALAIAFAIALYLARRIVEPINALHAGAARIERGNLAERISFRSGDELQDLGEQFNAMAARLQESYADLERKVVERTSELEKANLAKTRFLAVASHDLRQPLHALGMFVGQLKARVEDFAQQRVVDQIEASLAAMNELFDALLDISRIDAQQLSPRITDFPVQRLLDRLQATFADMASRKGLSVRIPASPVWIRTDPMLLERIVANIVSNAVRYTRCGGVIVACRRRGGSLRIEVCDSGPGIPSDQLENVFNEFVRLVPAHADEKQGLGLGLAIVDRLSRLLAHRIEAKSVVGRGSRFSVMVPIVVTPVPIPKVIPSNARFADGLPIALIDDDAPVLELMGGLLRSWGFRVVEAASVDQAVAALERGGEMPGLIVADLGLTNAQTGVAAIEILRQAYGGSVPAFLISADVSDERLQHARSHRLELLRKPLSPGALRQALVRYWKDHRMPAGG